MKIKKNTSPLQRVLAALLVECIIVLGLAMGCAIFIAKGVVPQKVDSILAAVILAIAAIIGTRMVLPAGVSKKWLWVLILVGSNSLILLLANLCLKGSNGNLILLDLSVILAAGVLGMIPGAKKKKGYKIKY